MIKIPVNTPLLNGNEKKYVLEALDSSWISSEGPFIHEFEEKFAKMLGRKYAVAVSNGTAAIDISMEALNIRPGDEIIVPSFTIISCIHQILRTGATPVFVDCDPETWNIDVSLVEKNITSKTKIIIAVHIYGLPVDMNPLFKLAKKYNLTILEDSAEVLGQTYFSKPCGSLGDVSTFSFYSNKHITTGEGGMIVTDNKHIANKCRELRNLCFNKKKRFVHYNLGWNYRMTNLQAALGLAQLENISLIIKKKRDIGKYYFEALQNINLFQLQKQKTKFAENIFWVFGIVLRGKLNYQNTKAIQFLESKGIGCRPFFFPLHMQPVLRNYKICRKMKLPVSERIGKYGFYIPSGLAMSYSQCDFVIKKLKEMEKVFH